jgi:hypothetical protein
MRYLVIGEASGVVGAMMAQLATRFPGIGLFAVDIDLAPSNRSRAASRVLTSALEDGGA